VNRGGARAQVRIDRRVAPASEDALRARSDDTLFAALEAPLFLVDAGNLLWRAAHGHPAPFGAVDGRDLTPLFRFFVMLRRALGTFGLFAECVVCFDGADAWSSRLDIDDAYKANRRYADADLSFMGWLPEIRAALDAIGIANLELTQHEADDVIATLTGRAGTRSVRILSTDRDYCQLIGPRVRVVNTRSRPALVGPDELVAAFGVTAQQWCDFRALAGDPSDGIPGLAGIGKKRAAVMLAGGATLNDLRTREAVINEHWEELSRWRELIRLRTDVDLDFEAQGRPTPRLPSPTAICRELGLV
jgi:DNA polymerase I